MGRAGGDKQGSGRPEKLRSREGMLTTVVWKKCHGGSGPQLGANEASFPCPPFSDSCWEALCVARARKKRLTLAFSRKMLSLGGTNKRRKPPQRLQQLPSEPGQKWLERVPTSLSSKAQSLAPLITELPASQ